MLPIIHIGEFGIYTFPIILLLDVYACLNTLIKSKKYNQLYIIDIFKATLFILPFILVFGKLMFVIINLMKGNVCSIQDVVFGGFVFYGGLIGGFTGLAVYAKIKKECFINFSDVFLSILPLGQSIGRIGCYLNGCCYGIKYQGIIAVKYYVDGMQCSLFPVWFVESMICLILFIIMQKMIHTNARGVYTSIYLISYSVARFILEFFRGDLIRGIWRGVSTSQIISIVFFIVGVIILTTSILNKQINKFIN